MINGDDRLAWPAHLSFRIYHLAFMDVPAAVVAPFKYRRWLPYWAVLRTDVRQTFRSWVYRLWVVVTILAAGGFLLYRFGVHREAGLTQPAAVHTSDLLRAVALGSLALIVILCVSSISSERGTLADSVLSRGISRYQYFLAKWHARTVVVVLTFAAMSSAMLGAFHFLLTDDLSLGGCLAAVVTISALLAAVVAMGVAVGSVSNSTVVGITALWIALYGAGLLMTLLPSTYPTPQKVLSRLPHVLQGQYNMSSLADWVLCELAAAVGSAVAGLLGFARKDVVCFSFIIYAVAPRPGRSGSVPPASLAVGGGGALVGLDRSGGPEPAGDWGALSERRAGGDESRPGVGLLLGGPGRLVGPAALARQCRAGRRDPGPAL